MSTETTDRQRPDVAAFIAYRATLIDAITESEILVLANALYSKGVISRYALEEAEMMSHTPTERKIRLLDVIEDKIKAEPGMFYTALTVLRSDSLCLSEHTRKLRHLCWQNLEPRSTPYHPPIWERYYHKALIEDFERRLKYLREALEKTPTEVDEEDSPESNDKQESQDFLACLRKGVRKLFGAARDLTASFVKRVIKSFNLDIHVSRKYKKRFDKHNNSEQVRWWFEIWGDESALTALESNWDKISAQTKWRLETCPVVSQRC